MLDAFRPDYLSKTPFLSYLSTTGWTGRFQEPFGFMPRNAYFRGSSAAESGYTHMFRLDRRLSAFAPARHFPREDELAPASRTSLREELRRHAAGNSTSFGSKFIHPMEIPFSFLPYFDIAEQNAPWESAGGHKSIFEELDQQHRQWVYLAWPVLETEGLHGDAQIVQGAVERITNETEFAFVQLCDLDWIGHVYGPGSPEIKAALERQDGQVRILLQGLHRKGIQPTVVLFGDHGMVNVVRHLDITSKLEEAKLKAPEHYLYFVDSTCVRFWYSHPDAKRVVHEAMAEVDSGHWLTLEEQQRYGMDGIDPANGEDVFMAEPGALFNPNFFHHSSAPPKGMHGYIPEEPDNQGVFVLFGAGVEGSGDAGLITPQKLHEMLRRWLIEKDSRGKMFHALSEVKSSDVKKAAKVRQDLALILDRISPVLRPFDTVVLHGGFGRGEGTMVKEAEGYRALNDYDVLVFGPAPAPAVNWKELGRELAGELDLPYVDLGWIDSKSLENPPKSILFYEILHGGRILKGDGDLIDRADRFSVAEMDPEEGVRLLFNRTAGVLTGLRADCLPPAGLNNKDREYLWIQASKIGMALADRYLLEWQAYDVKYAVRRRRFETLGRSYGIPSEALELLVRCYEWKSEPGVTFCQDPRPVLSQLIRLMRAEVARFLGGASPGNLGNVMRDYLHEQQSNPDGGRKSARAATALLLDTLDDELHPIQGRLDFAEDVLQQARLLKSTEMEKGTDPNLRYEVLRKELVEAWETQCH